MITDSTKNYCALDRFPKNKINDRVPEFHCRDTGNAVTIGGSVCNILTESSTVITCKTTPHSGPGEFPVMVTVPGKGIATVVSII